MKSMIQNLGDFRNSIPSVVKMMKGLTKFEFVSKRLLYLYKGKTIILMELI